MPIARGENTVWFKEMLAWSGTVMRAGQTKANKLGPTGRGCFHQGFRKYNWGLCLVT